MRHIIDHSWQSSNNGEAPFVKVRRKEAITTEGFKLHVTIASGLPEYSMNSVYLEMGTHELENLGMELIKIAAAAREKMNASH